MHSPAVALTWREELSATSRLAAPLVLGQLAAVALNVIDTLLAGRHGSYTLASVAQGAAMWSLVIVSLIGLMFAVPPTVAHLVGANRRDQVAHTALQALWIALIAGLLLFALVQIGAEYLLRWIGVDAALIPGVLNFVRPYAFGAPALAVFFALKGVSEGIGWSKPVMWIGAMGVMAMVPLGYFLAFGGLGLPELGARGLGIASAMTLWIQALAFAALLRWHPNFAVERVHWQWRGPHWPSIRELLRLGVPMGFSVFMEASLFVVSALLIGRLGETQAAAHQIAINLASISFMIPLGIAMAATVRVGQAAGANSNIGVKRAAVIAFGLMLIAQLLSASALLFQPAFLARLYSTDSNVIAGSIGLIGIAAVFQFSDGVQAVAGGVLRGLKDTFWPAVITSVSYWAIGMSLGYWLAFDQGMNARGLWFGLVAGLSAAATLLVIRFILLLRSQGWRPDLATSDVPKYPLPSD